jgi:hypothetical protein
LKDEHEKAPAFALSPLIGDFVEATPDSFSAEGFIWVTFAPVTNCCI